MTEELCEHYRTADQQGVLCPPSLLNVIVPLLRAVKNIQAKISNHPLK